jgi:Flp pilus assembly protein TadD
MAQGAVDDAAIGNGSVYRQEAQTAEEHRHLAERLRSEGRFAEAIAAYRGALRLEPGHCVARMDLSVALSQQGKLTEAEAEARAAVQCQPDHAHAHCNLGNILLREGKVGEAETSYRQALRLKPDLAIAHANLGAILYDSRGDCAGASAAFREATRLKPHEPAYHHNLGNALARQGMLADAEAAYRKALRLKPDLAETHNRLGALLCDHVGDDEGALAAFGEALRLKPDEAVYHNNYGIGLASAGRPADAEAAYRKALHLQPDYADACSNLGEALADQRRLDEAVAAYREALRLKPESSRPYFNLVKLATQGWYEFSDLEIDCLTGLAERPDLPEHDATLFAFALGDLLDHRGEYDQAFSYYRRGNHLRRQALQHESWAFDAGRHRANVDHIITTFDGALFERVKDWGVHTDLPVFIVGMPRSGTSLVEQVLASHPAVYGAGELPYVPQLTRDLARAHGGADAYPACASRLGREAVTALAEQYLARLSRLGKQALRVTDKLPDNHLHLGLIAALFPRARIIHCQRDPLDVAVSCYCNFFRRMAFAYSLEDIGAYYRQYQRLMAHWQDVLPLRIHTINYEDLVARQEAVSRELVRFCGLEWDERCLAFHANRRAVQTASRFQVRRPMYSQAVGRWRRYEAYLQPLFDALDDRTGP